MHRVCYKSDMKTWLRSIFFKRSSSFSRYDKMNLSQSGREAQQPPQVTVHFYGSGFCQVPPLSIPIPSDPDEEIPLTCESVCIQSAKHLKKKLGHFYQCTRDGEIGPSYLPLFGLYVADHSLQQWINDAHMFTEPQEVYFRVKLRLARGKIPEGIVIDYMFMQIADDFRAGRLWSHFEEKNVIEDIRTLVVYIVWELAASGRYRTTVTEDSKKLMSTLEQLTKKKLIQKKITLLRLEKVMPQNLSEALRKEFSILDPLMRYLMYNKLKDVTATFCDDWKDQTIEMIRLQFVEDVVYKDVPYYGLEYYPAKRVDTHDGTSTNQTDVEVIIRPYQDGCAPGVYFTKQLVCRLDAIVSVKISEQESHRKMKIYRVQLDRHNGHPVILDFQTKAAESFVSLLESYYRMQVNFYYSLTEGQFASPTFKVLQALRSFGPLRDEDAAERLKGTGSPDDATGSNTSSGREPCYIIYQDCHEFNLLHVMAGGEEQMTSNPLYNIILRPNRQCELLVDFSLHNLAQNASEVCEQPDRIRVKLNNLFGRQIIPRDEQCKGMECLKEEDMLIPYYETNSTPSRNADTSDRLCLFEEEELTVDESHRIARGLFTDVYRVEHRKQGREVVIKKMTEKRSEIEDAYIRGMAHLHSLRRCSHFFTRFYGQMMLRPLRFVMESVPLCSLLQRLSMTPRLNWLQIGSVLVQLGRCLYDLKANGMTYGSFCCKRILIHQESLEHLRIKLGDPCETFYLDTLPVDDQLNTSRLPWVAVERFAHLSSHTFESDIYALGTTIWEMITGKDPDKEISPLGVKEFFETGNMLPAPGPSPTQEWVDKHNFEGAKSVPVDAPVSNYCKGDPEDADASTTEGSEQFASGDTAMTCVSGSPAASQSNRVSAKEQIIDIVVKLMEKCWNREPSERPTPNYFIKEAQKVVELGAMAKEEDPAWQARLVLEAVRETNNVTNETAFKDLQKRLAEQWNESIAGRDKEDVDILRKLQEQCSERFIEMDRLRMKESGRPLGKGNFGEVQLAELFPACTTREEQRAQTQKGGVPVAVKQMSDPSGKNKQLFLKEALMWSKLHEPNPHNNIVLLHGIVLPALQSNPSSPFLLVMEYADKGSLEAYVKKHITELGMTEFQSGLCIMGKDVAEGMAFLAEKGLTHGDLAARNILLFNGDSHRKYPRAKVSDFGLAHWLKGGAKGYYQRDNSLPLPAYWMALEVLEEDRFNSMTDVWSFGVVLWEMFSGDDPANALNTTRLPNDEVVDDLKRKYRRNERLCKPTNCPHSVYDVMRKCWDIDRERRPKFEELADTLERLAETDLN